MELIESKIIAMVGLGLSSMFVGLLPSWFSQQGRQQWPLLLSSLLCFGGGVLLSTALIHMLPEIRTIVPKYQNFAELIFCTGFFVVYIIDEIVHFFYGGHGHENKDHQDDQNNVKCKQMTYCYHQKKNYGSVEYDPLLYDNKCDQNRTSRSYIYEEVSNSRSDTEDRPPSQLCHIGHQQVQDTLPVGNIGLLVALCVHALLEGLAIGLQQSPSQVLLLLGAVASHKLVVGFCLGIELTTESKYSACGNFIMITIFSCGSVLGIGIGTLITEIPTNVLEIIFPILQGLAAGALLYVTLSEIIPRERARWHKQHRRKVAGILQLLAVLFGFIIMTCVTLFMRN